MANDTVPAPDVGRLKLVAIELRDLCHSYRQTATVIGSAHSGQHMDRSKLFEDAARACDQLVAFHSVPSSASTDEKLLAIAGLVNGYHNGTDQRAQAAFQALRAIADVLGRPMEPSSAPTGEE